MMHPLTLICLNILVSLVFYKSVGVEKKSSSAGRTGCNSNRLEGLKGSREESQKEGQKEPGRA